MYALNFLYFYLAFLYSETIIKGKDKLVGTLFSASKGGHLLFTEAIGPYFYIVLL